MSQSIQQDPDSASLKVRAKFKPSVVLTSEDPVGYCLDECNLIKNNKLKKYLGYYNSRDISKTGISDDELLKKALEKNLIIITSDIRFALKTVLKGIEIVFQDSNGVRTLIPKNKTKIIECSCFSGKHDSKLSHYLVSSEEVVWP